MNAQELLGLREAYLGLYGEVLEGSLADMFSAANDDLFKKSQKHSNAAQERLRRLNQSLEDTYGKVKPTKSSSSNPESPQKIINRIKTKLTDAEKMMRQQDSEQHESYDLIISHLLDEGYANTPEEAQVILDNMSEGWKTDILKKTVETTGKAAKYVVKKGWKAAKPTVKKYAKKAGRFALMTALGVPL